MPGGAADVEPEAGTRQRPDHREAVVRDEAADVARLRVRRVDALAVGPLVVALDLLLRGHRFEPLESAGSAADEGLAALHEERTRVPPAAEKAAGPHGRRKSATARAAMRMPAAFGCCVSWKSGPSDAAAAKAGSRSRQRSSNWRQS